MGRSLRSLEQSLAKPRATAAKKANGTHGNTKARAPSVKKTAGFSASLPLEQLAPAQLQEQIDVIRGRRIAQPTRSLRALEDRVLGRAPQSTQQRETLRLDKGQVASTKYTPQNTSQNTPATSYPSIPYPSNPYPTTPNGLPISPPLVSSANPNTGASPLPPTGTVSAASLWPQPSQRHPAAAAAPYAPEFSAPGSGRFQVESFAGPLSPDELFKPDAAVSASPDINATRNASAPGLAPAIASPNFQSNSAQPRLDLPVNDDAIGWLAQAQSEQPKKITSASKQSLNSGLALAKDDFERELAAILGQPSNAAAPVTTAPTVVPPAADPLFQNAQPQNSQAQPTPPPSKPVAPDPNAPPPHPSHDVFDQMGLGMRYANSFDLGNINLNERFKRIEQDLEPATTARSQRTASPMTPSPFVDPYANPMSLDEFDLVAELAEISAEKPICPPNLVNAPKTTRPNSTDTTTGEHHEQPIG